MSEKPIIFSNEMVGAILDGRKTQTRRVLAEQRHEMWPRYMHGRWEWRTVSDKWAGAIKLPYAPGDVLWVRETWCNDIGAPNEIAYRATAMDDGWEPDEVATHRWRSSIHMPRWASRISLRVTDVRVQRLQEINEDDAIAEGCGPFFDHANKIMVGPRDAFQALWDCINGKKAGIAWADNPWVAAITFERARP